MGLVFQLLKWPLNLKLFPSLELITDPTGVYGKKLRSKRSEILPFIYQSAPPVSEACKNSAAASTSIISGAKAVDFAAFAIGALYESFVRKRMLVKYQSQSEVIKAML